MAPPDPKARKARRAALRPTGGLKAFADAKRYDESLVLGPTQKHVLSKEGRDLSRRQDIIHPSEMSHGDWCPKATYLRIKNLRDGGTFTKEAFGFQSLNIFQHGHEVHHKWQTWLWQRGVLWGEWKCLNNEGQCNWSFYATAPSQCPNCDSTNLEYAEVPLSAEEELLIEGSADGFVPDIQALMEFKTVGEGTLRFEEPELLKAHTHKTVDGKSLVDYPALWKGINRPFRSHQKQGQIYLWIAEILGINADKVVYIYESKFNQGTKEFVVQRRQKLIQPLLDSAQEIKDALDHDGPVPECPRGGCKHCEPKSAEKEKESGQETASAGKGSPRTDRPAARRQGTVVRRQATRGDSRTPDKPRRADG
ncbi:hypothetical protein ACFYP4_02800 [Streptomyces sp. NPDC005551]|uniref:hypothetical protein n=1 Tax=Streptomyces sp. NPDC005551 TaxID=3364725 RepID=UPI0036753B43